MDFLTIKPTIIKMLNLVEYDDDKDTFANEILMLCSQRTIIEIIKHLPFEQRESIRQKLSQGDSDEYITRVLDEAIAADVYKDEFKRQVKRTLEEYLTQLRPTLSDYRYRVLEEFLNSTFPLS